MTIHTKSQRRLKPAVRHGAQAPRHAPPRRSTPPSRTGSSPYRYIDPSNVFTDLLPDLAESSNDFAWACCPFHDDHNPSFSVNLRTGWYRCFSSSCGVTGSNIGSFVGALLGLSPAEARRHLESTYG